MHRIKQICMAFIVLATSVSFAGDAVDERAKRLDKLRDQYLDAKQKLIGAEAKFKDSRTEYEGAIRTFKDDLLPRVLKPHQDLLDTDARSGGVSVVSAEYGAIGSMRDVSKQAKAFLSFGKPIPADCYALGIQDPADKVVKTLRVVISVGVEDLVLTTRDGGEITVGAAERK